MKSSKLLKILCLIFIFTCILTKKIEKKIQTRQKEASKIINQKCYDKNCISCPSSPDVCDECKNLIYEKKCYNKCPEGTFIYGNTCNTCSKNCLKCDNTQCFSCAKGFFEHLLQVFPYINVPSGHLL